MIDTWLCRRYPGGLPVGVTRDTRRNRSVPGEIHSRDTWRTRRLPVNLHLLDSQRTRGLPGNTIREDRGALGGFRGIPFARIAAHSEAPGRVLSVWVLGTRGVLAWHPEGSLGV